MHARGLIGLCVVNGYGAYEWHMNGEQATIRLLCHVDESWFRLHYLALTEQHLEVPPFVEWVSKPSVPRS